MSERQHLRLSESDALTETPEGSWIIADPTGRDMNECLEVGQVTKELIRNEDGDTCALVAFNSSGIVAVTEIRATL